jgi:hypothetical protein
MDRIISGLNLDFQDDDRMFRMARGESWPSLKILAIRIQTTP